MRAEPVARSLSLTDLYAPVALELQRAQHIFRDELTSDLPLVDELCRYVEQFHGKRLRPALLLLAGRACGPLSAEHALLAGVVEMVHLATLVHDDVLDDGDVRRRVPTVNRRWGNARAVLLGDILFSHAYHLCSRARTPRAAEEIARTAVAVGEGELLQIARRDDEELSEAEYLEIIGRKTAALVGTCTLLGARAARADEGTCSQLREYGTALGIAFQITDDLLDLVGDEAVAGKSLRRDAEQGELTLPLIHFLREAPAAQRTELVAVLHDDTPRNGRLSELLKASASVAYAQRSAEAYVERARACLACLPASPARRSLDALAEFVLARQY